MQIRPKKAEGKWVEEVCDHVIACTSLKGRISDMKVTGMERAKTAEGVTWKKWRKITRKKRGRERRKERRRGRRGKWRKKSQ